MDDNNEGTVDVTNANLFDCVKRSLEFECFQLMLDGVDVNMTDEEGKTPLYYANQNPKQVGILCDLINAGARFDIAEIDVKTALFYSVRYDFVAGSSALIEAGADVNMIDDDGKTPLHYAAKNSTGTVCDLIDAGARFSLSDFDNKTALFYAVGNKMEDVVRKLIEAGVDVNMRDDKGKTVLFYAVVLNDNITMIDLLIEEGKALVNARDSLGRTPFFYALTLSRMSAAFHLIDKRGDLVFVRDNNNMSPLSYFIEECMKNNADLDSCLNIIFDVFTNLREKVRERNTDVFTKAITDIMFCRAPFLCVLSKNPCTKKTRRLVDEMKTLCKAMKKAIQGSESGKKWEKLLKDLKNEDHNGVLEILEFLRVELDADQNSADTDGNNSLHYATILSVLGVSQASVLGICLKLLELGTMLNHKNCLNETPLHFFLSEENLKSFAGKYGQMSGNPLLALCRFFVQHGANVSETTQNGETVFHLTVKLIHSSLLIQDGKRQQDTLNEALKVLEFFTKTASKNVVNYCDTVNLNSPLHLCASLPFPSQDISLTMTIIGHLLEGGALVNARNWNDETPLHLCRTWTALKLLVDKGANPKASAHQTSPLLAAAKKKAFRPGFFYPDVSEDRKKFWKSALKMGLDLWTADEHGMTVLGILVESEDYRLAKSLVNVACEENYTQSESFTICLLNDICKDKSTQTRWKMNLIDDILKSRRDATNLITPLRYCITNILEDESAKEPPAKRKRMNDDFDRTTTKNEEDEDENQDRDEGNQGDGEQGDGNQGDGEQGDGNQGDGEQVDGNQGDGEQGDGNQGDGEQGDGNQGDGEQGDGNQGDGAQGDGNQGDGAQGDGNQGDGAQGDGNQGDGAQGDGNQGDGAQGDRSRGDEDEGNDGGQHREEKDYENKNIERYDDDKLLQPTIKRKGEVINGDESETYNSVHYSIAKLLLSFGADYRTPDQSGMSCLDLAKSSSKLKEFLTKPTNIDSIATLVPWVSVSKKYENKLAKVARRQEFRILNQILYHRDPIGSGSFGHIFAGINEKDGREVAIKRIERLRLQRPEEKREIQNFTALAYCQQVVRYVSFFEDQDFCYAVLELMEGNLEEYFNESTIDASEATLLCKDVVMGLKFLHEQNILHRDLKPQNILYKTHPKLCLKIADFGLSRRIDSIKTTVYGTNAGTRCWIAPEILKSPKDHSKSSDIFSCGLILHYILSAKRHPFCPADCANKSEIQVAHETEDNLMKGKMEGWNNSLSPEASHLVKKMIESTVESRPTAEEAIDHPLFWTKVKKIDFLIAVGNQPEFECPRSEKTMVLTAIETDLENSFSTIVKYGSWDDPKYRHMPAFYNEKTRRRRKYDTNSVVELVRFIRNAYAHVSEDMRPIFMQDMLFTDFVFLEYFSALVMKVYKAVITHGWDQTRDEIKYAMNK